MKAFDYIGSRVAGYGCLLIFAALCAAATTVRAQALAPGQVVGWGDNTFGQTTIPVALKDVSAIAAGAYFNVALRSGGTVSAWGDNTYGETNIPTGLTDVTAVAASTSSRHGLALKKNGTVVGWGDNTYGQTTVPACPTGFTAIAAGANHSLALCNGTVVGWGNNDLGQSTPPTGLTGATAIAGGLNHSLALINGTVVGWGDNTFGQSAIPTGLILAGRVVTAIAAGPNHSLALLSDGTVVGWGNNGDGQTNAPAGLTNVVAIAAGSYHSLAVQSGGKIVAWGANNYGQATVPDNLTGAATGVTAVMGGDFHSLAANLVPLQAAGVPFSSFTPSLPLSNKNAFAFGAVATIAPNGAAFNPQTDTVTLTMNAAVITIPPNSFRLESVSNYVFKGMIGNIKLVATIVRQGSNKYLVGIGGSGASFTPSTNPVAITLAIGANIGNKSVKALITK